MRSQPGSRLQASSLCRDDWPGPLPRAQDGRPQFREMEAALGELNESRDSPRGTIRLSAGEHPAVAVLQPKLAPFLAQYPDVEVEILIDAGLIDIVADGFDAGVRLGEQLARDMIAVRISPDIRMAVVGAPSYFEHHPMPKAPEELTDHRCIRTRLPNHGELFSWPLERDGEERRIRVEGPAVFNTLSMRVASALDGIGLVFLPLDQVEAHLAEGRLLPVLEDWWPTWEGYHIYYPSRRNPSPAFKLLVDMLRHR